MKYSIRENTDGGRTVFVTAGEYSQTIAWILALVLLFVLSLFVGSQFAKEGFVRDKSIADRIAVHQKSNRNIYNAIRESMQREGMTRSVIDHAMKEFADRKKERETK